MSEEVAIGMSHPDMPDKQKIVVGKRLKMEVLAKLGRESGVHSEEDEYGRKKVDVKQGGEDPFGREPHFVQEQKQKLDEQEENLLGLPEWRKKMLRRMG